jgi:hypothetical protein
LPPETRPPLQKARSSPQPVRREQGNLRHVQRHYNYQAGSLQDSSSLGQWKEQIYLSLLQKHIQILAYAFARGSTLLVTSGEGKVLSLIFRNGMVISSI